MANLFEKKDNINVLFNVSQGLIRGQLVLRDFDIA
jgi:hypothetical protein